MRLLFLFLSAMLHALFLPITLGLAVGLVFGSWFIGRQLRPPRTSDAPGELGATEWLGHPRGEWLGA